MGYKKQRFGTKLAQAAASGERYRDTHVFIGGTGAVGGTALLQMLLMYEEMMSIRAPDVDDVPILVATGKGDEDIEDITARLFRLVQSRHGKDMLPRKTGQNYLTHSGIFVGLESFELTALPDLSKVLDIPLEDRPEFVRSFLSRLSGAGSDCDRLTQAVAKARQMSDFLKAYRAQLPPDRQSSRFRSVVIGIPIPSLVAYHFDYLKEAAPYVPGLDDARLEELKNIFRDSLREDLKEMRTSLSDVVLLAHTTAIGGMYNEELDEGGKAVRTIRLGFSHSAQDTALVDKQYEAEKFAEEFSEIGIKVLITAAAIGIDEVRIREKIPLHKQIAAKLWDAPVELFPGSKKAEPAESKESKGAGRPEPARQFISLYEPLKVPLDDPAPDPVRFKQGEVLRPTYSIRSGENGFFSVSNADALYRVMRVASASELGYVMATVGLFGDDKLSPWFPGDVCYYTEGDNSRQVFDLLNQPQLLQMQLSGLEPLALQELGSSKHQGELHTLSLLILLNRIRTLDIDTIDPYVDLEHFDAARFLIEHSRPLRFDDLENWQIADIAQGMQILASAEAPEDLVVLNPSRYSGLFESKDKAVYQVFKRALEAVWMIPSLGSPLLFEKDGRTWIRTGYFVAPLALLVTEANSIDQCLRKQYEAHKREMFEKNESLCTFDEYRDFHICTGGFVDLRQTALLCTAKTTEVALTGRVRRFADEQSLREALFRLEPYSFFTTCGLVALLFRLRGLYHQMREAMAELGTLHEFRWQMPRDVNGHILVVPGAVEAFRMVSEGLEKTTGTERLDGIWGYERLPTPERWDDIPGISPK